MNIIFLTLILAMAVGPVFAKWQAKELTPLQHKVTKEGGTEPPFNNEYWNNKRPGIYVDVNTGEALFSSLDKYDSGTGWPSFTKSIDEEKVEMKNEFNWGMLRKEVRSKGGSHLGHVFDDGPKDRGGKRFCINSASLKFIPLEDMEKEGYVKYLERFNGQLSGAK